MNLVLIPSLPSGFEAIYLTNRCQCVVVDSNQSTILPVISGVPQGSVLGQLLFLIFINEVVLEVSPESTISLFADDMALYRPICSSCDYNALQEDISTLVNWINSVLLALQPSKCCAMLISRKRGKSLPPLTFTVDGAALALVNSVRYLGMQITSDLYGSSHISNLYAKTRKLIGLFYRQFY